MWAAVILGTYSVLSVETLSLLDTVTRATLTNDWPLPLLSLSNAFGILWRRDRRLRLHAFTFHEGWDFVSTWTAR